ncbi:MAG: hypothetical protein KC420_07805 [Myxococcales bacterium]|nr:hypothetical protein [Myxococcales bacterium]MCB9565862.1 hypothetical protein [Myxococcales bacterium]MCB9702952.1 hypothetical protein [Myxococcales bacterium]
MSYVRSALIHAAIFAVGAVTAIACYQADYGNPAFRCAPVDGADSCPEDYTCCSDDPAAQNGLLPAYRGTPPNDTYGVAIFSEMNNALSAQGMCVQLSGIANPLLNGCPVPCNPTWSTGDISTVCGGVQCCQTEQVNPDKDCIVDPMTGRWRAVTGADILAGLTSWGGLHETNQDPKATGCGLFAGTTDAGNPTFADCLDQLGVANQRGFCNANCPCVEDLCERKNPDSVPKCL